MKSVFGFAIGTVLMFAASQAAQHDFHRYPDDNGFSKAAAHFSFKQKDFPCQEDEVLLYINTPSSDDLGCLNYEDFTAFTGR